MVMELLGADKYSWSKRCNVVWFCMTTYDQLLTVIDTSTCKYNVEIYFTARPG